MENNEIVRTACNICPMGCGALVYVSKGKAVKIEGDPDCPILGGQLCIKGQASLEYVYHPDRLKHPLKRTGKRGEGKWQRISWDEALDTVAGEFSRIKVKHGAEAVAFMRGSGKGLQDNWFRRFANVFGSPNNCSTRNVCDSPRAEAGLVTCGFVPYCDYKYPPACIVVWGSNTAETRPDQYRNTLEAMRRGTKLIVIDPKEIEFAKKAEHWLQLRPGTDVALALGMMNVIINEELYDKDFVERWTTGFNELKAHVQAYPPEKVSEITWVDAEKTKAAARFYANTKPACIEWGNGVDQNRNSSQAGRSITILRAITGSLDIPGGDILRMQPPILPRFGKELILFDKLLETQRQKSVGLGFKLMERVHEAVLQKVIEAILTGKPYPIRAAYNMGWSAHLTGGNAQKIHEAFQKLEFSVAAEMFMTPTAALCDIVLPVTSYVEYDSIAQAPKQSMIRVQQKVVQVGECRSDYQIISELARKMGLGEYFWDTEEQALDAVLKPIKITFKEFRELGSVSATMKYRKYEANGFNTPSRKVELYSRQFEEWGYDPLPIYRELPETPLSDPESAEEYPLYYISRKRIPYRHSGGRQIASLRISYPEPLVKMHPDTANNLGIKQGDWVYIETKRGRIKQKAELTDSLDPRVVDIDYSWWFPEKGITELYDWKSSNLNILTSDEQPYSPEIGSLNLRGVLCKVYKA